MGFDTEPNKKAEAQEVRIAERDSRAKALDEVFNLRNPASGWHGEPIAAGQIESVQLPSNWKPGPDKEQRGPGTYREFWGPQPDGGRLSFFDRGQRLSDKEASTLTDLLEHKSGALTTKEIGSLGSTLFERCLNAKEFKLTSIAVTTLNGRKVLEVDGRYLSNDPRFEADSKQYYIAVTGDSHFVQRLEFQSSPDVTVKLRPAFDGILKTLKWK